MFETQKVRRYDKFRKEWSQHKNKCKSQMGQDRNMTRIHVGLELSFVKLYFPHEK